MHWCDGYGYMGWMAIWWMILVPALVAVAVWALLKSTRGLTRGPGEPPEEIVKRRYATGEIDRETYQRMLAELKS